MTRSAKAKKPELLPWVEQLEVRFRELARQPAPSGTSWRIPPGLTWRDGFHVAYADLAEVCAAARRAWNHRKSK